MRQQGHIHIKVVQLFQHLAGRGKVGFQFNIRIVLPQLENQIHRDRWRDRPHSQQAGFTLLETLQQLHRFLFKIKQGLGDLVELLSGRAQFQLIAGAIKQLDIKTLFQSPDLFADGRLPNAEITCGRGEAAGMGDGIKRSQPFVVLVHGQASGVMINDV